ncbi:hypothetical protein SAMD00019534_093740 [Acytostelium subglobosum LB1]|uniref:hypothetical protein n=1 Tax=Acytostelium subglobosum LB1 TaxID=1410327 RepID=UPI000644F6D6|nr:hypothetical protein SAMD00019534_093740 [Acytostelium subglobosum LB1]GAM26199.1 hypothetical protein SAMD00019534_093740 [Acytostelium subglobosum LB1]|eukprot:XP_012750753.1 hypothetical protein SAMD00019534_093740 [Acytostelium subglobosum LB1]
MTFEGCLFQCNKLTVYPEITLSINPGKCQLYFSFLDLSDSSTIIVDSAEFWIGDTNGNITMGPNIVIHGNTSISLYGGVTVLNPKLDQRRW